MKRKQKEGEAILLMAILPLVYFYIMAPKYFGLGNSGEFLVLWWVIIPTGIIGLFAARSSFKSKTQHGFLFLMKNEELKKFSIFEFIFYKIGLYRERSNVIKNSDMNEKGERESFISMTLLLGLYSKFAYISSKLEKKQVPGCFQFQTEDKKTFGCVYILSNKCFPGLLKIGKTKRSVSERVSELNTTGLPSKFEVELIIYSVNYSQLERSIHYNLAGYRSNARREFFKIDRDVAILKTLAICKSEKMFLTDLNEINLSSGIGDDDKKFLKLINYI
jgi:hypothetical protein